MSEEVDEELEGELIPANIIDKVALGRRLKALRHLQGYDRAADFARDMRRTMGVDVSERTVYAIERGEQMPHLDFFFGAIALLKPDARYFHPAVRPDIAAAIDEVVR